MNGKRANERSVSDAWMHVYALQAGTEAQTSKKAPKNMIIQANLSPGRSLRLQNPLQMRSQRRPGATSAPEPHFGRFLDPLWRPLRAPETPQGRPKSAKGEPKGCKRIPKSRQNEMKIDAKSNIGSKRGPDRKNTPKTNESTYLSKTRMSFFFYLIC